MEEGVKMINNDAICPYIPKESWCDIRKGYCQWGEACNKMQEQDKKIEEMRQSIDNGNETAREIMENCNQLRKRAWSAEGELKTLRTKYDALRSSFLELSQASAEKTVKIKEHEMVIDDLKEIIKRHEKEILENVLTVIGVSE